ncbi:hypothetical protein RIF29_24420 [Crotalaria pallida]|uniref:RING-type E3 ubiquitin transferase n=1 Tax=Crotalaria pallida TaxID=3830 RepID=A0AAN9HYF6_CROPI
MKTISTALYISFFFSVPLAAAQSETEPDDYYPAHTAAVSGLTPPLAIIITVLVAAFFLMGFFSIYLRHCANGANSSVQTHAAVPRGRPRKAGPRGLDKAVIDTFPMMEYSEVKIHKIGKDALECAVCLSEFEDSHTLRLIPKCDHVFHPECIDEWLSNHTTCPVCRANLVPQPGESVHALRLASPRDIEAQQNHVEIESAPEITELPEITEGVPSEPEIELNPVSNNNNKKALNRTRTGGSRSNRLRGLPRSHSTGHSLLVRPGQNLERFTLRLPLEVRKRVINRQLQRASSFILLPNRTDCEGSNRGKISKLLNLSFKHDRWVFTMQPPFLVSAPSPHRGANSSGEGASGIVTPPLRNSGPIVELGRHPV